MNDRVTMGAGSGGVGEGLTSTGIGEVVIIGELSMLGELSLIGETCCKEVAEVS